MKKNKILRLASVMLMLCLITTCAISGTFAKYTTSGTATDSARVAKWGVTIDVSAQDALFATEYKNEEKIGTTDVGNGLSVQATEDLVAPGTTGALVIKLAGTPEVAVKVTYSATLELGENWKGENGEFYCPIVFNINGTEIKQDATNDTAEKLENAVKTAIDAYTKDYAVGTNLSTVADAAPSISWTWAIGSASADDTALGNAAAAGTAIPEIELSVDVTVTQIN